MENLMPALFIGHGSPMNALYENDFTKSLSVITEKFEKPKAIIVISAHWLTNGTFINSTVNPVQIYDFYGFPQALYQIKYPCHGSPTAANLLSKHIVNTNINLDINRGNDHAAWAILKHMYPLADIPVLELSIDHFQNLEYHFQLGKELKELRKQGILFIGSGNLVHNLRYLENEINHKPYDWALVADTELSGLIKNYDVISLLSPQNLIKEIRMGIPSLEHFIPLLYILGMKNEDENICYFYEGIQNASVSMRSFIME